MILPNRSLTRSLTPSNPDHDHSGAPMHPTSSRRPFTRRFLATSLAAGLVLAGCGSDGGSDGAEVVADETTTTTAPAEAPITILISNDDGYEASGIDALAEGLATLEGVELVVYAPLEEQSGTGGKSTEGELEVTDVELTGGTPARAVDGFPADTIRVAMDDEGIEPDLVITGINIGQNLGPVVDFSGTVGAARAAVARGVPALATSSGLIAGADADVEAGVPFVLEWVTEHRDAIAAGELEVGVWNMNFPSCADGAELRGLLEVESGVDEPIGDALTEDQDCASTVPEAELTNDVLAFNDGFATLSDVPSEAAEEPEVVPAGEATD